MRELPEPVFQNHDSLHRRAGLLTALVLLVDLGLIGGLRGLEASGCIRNRLFLFLLVFLALLFQLGILPRDFCLLLRAFRVELVLAGFVLGRLLVSGGFLFRRFLVGDRQFLLRLLRGLRIERRRRWRGGISLRRRRLLRSLARDRGLRRRARRRILTSTLRLRGRLRRVVAAALLRLLIRRIDGRTRVRGRRGVRLARRAHVRLDQRRESLRDARRSATE